VPDSVHSANQPIWRSEFAGWICRELAYGKLSAVCFLAFAVGLWPTANQLIPVVQVASLLNLWILPSSTSATPSSHPAISLRSLLCYLHRILVSLILYQNTDDTSLWWLLLTLDCCWLHYHPLSWVAFTLVTRRWTWYLREIYPSWPHEETWAFFWLFSSSTLIFWVYWSLVFASRRQSYCIGRSSGMGLSVFSARNGPVRERVDDGSVGAIDISRFRCSGLSG
jgi:hypothetical protein